MTDSLLERIVGNLLRVGVSLAAGVVLAGGAWYLAAHGSGHIDYRHFHPGPQSVPWTRGLPPALQAIQTGLLLLVATPVARVVFSLAAFCLERDKAYVAITLVVLAILTYSLVAS